MHPFGKEVRNKGRQTDTEVYNITVFQLLGGTTGDKGFNLFFFHS